MPEEWKLVGVTHPQTRQTSIPKHGKPADSPQNTCPVSTSVQCKLMERIVFARIEWTAKTEGKYHPAQTGFRNHLDTPECAPTAPWNTRLQSSQKPGSNDSGGRHKYIFDTIPHAAVIDSLMPQGITGRAPNFVKASLKVRNVISSRSVKTRVMSVLTK